MKADRGLQARFRQRFVRQLNVGHLYVVRHLFAAEPYGVNRDALAFDFRDGLEIDAAGVVSSVAQQDNCADGQSRGIGDYVLQVVADVRGRFRSIQLIELLDALETFAETIKPNLKFSL